MFIRKSTILSLFGKSGSEMIYVDKTRFGFESQTLALLASNLDLVVLIVRTLYSFNV